MKFLKMLNELVNSAADRVAHARDIALEKAFWDSGIWRNEWGSEASFRNDIRRLKKRAER